MGYKLYFTQTRHDPQVWGRMDCDWAQQMRVAYSRLQGVDHELVGTAEAADLIVFWEPHQDAQAVWAPRLRAHPLVRRFPNKAFVVSVEDNPLGFLPGLYCSLPKRLFNPLRHRTCFYQRTPNPYVFEKAGGRARNPELLASFVGASSHSIRDWLFSHRGELMRHGIQVRKTLRGRYNTNPTDPALEGERLSYVDSNLNAKFCLCPRGNGVAVFRLQESLALGRPPVIISDEWVPIEGPDWHSFAVFVKERDLALLPSILRKHEPHWREMGDSARRAYETFFANDNYLRDAVRKIVEIYQNRRHDERDFVALWDIMIDEERRRRAPLGEVVA